MSSEMSTLYYVHDPMCSWCWGFRSVWQQVQEAIKDKVSIRYVLGGLAPDNNQPMPESMRASIMETWRTIEKEIPGTEFNYDFWTACKPRRSTYPSCRAVIAAGLQGLHHEKSMLLAIQQAYYLQAKNPSDDDVLLQLAEDIGLDCDRFRHDYMSETCRNKLESELLLTRDLYVSSFPALVLSHDDTYTPIHIDYKGSNSILQQILQKLAMQS